MAQQRNVALEKAVDSLAQFVPGRPRISDRAEHIAEIAITQFSSMQKPRELAGLLRVTQTIRPHRIVEIGTARGGTLFALSQAAPDNAAIVSIDRPQGPGGGGYRAREEFAFARRRVAGQTMHFIRADSHYTGQDPYSTESRLKELLDGEAVDLLFIDGDHSYNGVRHDFETYSQLVRPGGHIALHDVVANPSDPTIEVSSFWQELKEMATYPHISQFVDPAATPGMPAQGAGIGVIRV